MSAAFSGVGTQFNRWNSSTHAWVTLAEVSNISGPSMTRDFIDVTNFDSEDSFREFISGFRDSGTVSFVMNFTRTSYDIMKTDYEDDDLQDYEIILTDSVSTSFQFQGLVTELPLEVPVDDKVTVNVTIKISGAVTVNSGSGSA